MTTKGFLLNKNCERNAYFYPVSLKGSSKATGRNKTVETEIYIFMQIHTFHPLKIHEDFLQ